MRAALIACEPREALSDALGKLCTRLHESETCTAHARGGADADHSARATASPLPPPKPDDLSVVTLMLDKWTAQLHATRRLHGVPRREQSRGGDQLVDIGGGRARGEVEVPHAGERLELEVAEV